MEQAFNKKHSQADNWECAMLERKVKVEVVGGVAVQQFMTIWLTSSFLYKYYHRYQAGKNIGLMQVPQKNLSQP
jgi:hypothetical protein